MSLQLRPYQVKIIDSLRKGFAAGRRTQILYAPTGAGKTEMAIELLKATKTKGNKAAMILDRIVLCDQTSQRLEKYSIDHGVLQSGHWRYRPYEHIQVCSAQTLERRGTLDELALLIVDEAHQTRQQTVEFIKNNPNVKVIGLTATPFTKGLGRVYDGVVSSITTKELVDQGVLVPLRIFIAKEIDMEGAKKVAGEWSQQEATSRGMQITGDIVNEWIKKTHEIFGGPRKTIIFCAGVEHGVDLSRKFAEQGYNFISVSYKDDQDFKKEVIEDFSRPDTEIHGLIATDILTKGFDVPDVMIGVSARPFSKSLSSHIQQMGRVMRANMADPESKQFAVWLCLAKGSMVLTDSGLVPIDKVKLTHKIWDGTNFVTHGGAVCNGIQEVITYQGLTATPGHLVHTAEGWRTFGECAAKQIRITQTGFGRAAVRLGENLRPTSFLAGRAASKIYSCVMRMFGLWVQKPDKSEQPAIRKNQGLSSVQSAGCGLSNVVVQQSASHESKVRQQKPQSLPRVWRAWSRIQIFWRQRSHSLDHGELGFAGVQNGGGAFPHSVGQNRPERTLRAWEYAMAFCGAKPTEQARDTVGGANAQIQDGKSRDSICRQHFKAFLLGWHDGRTDHRKIQPTLHKTQREVWDILDAGPNNRFTCEGLLVHNCHSGNYLRFREEWEDIFENGVHELDDGKEKAKKEPTKKEKEDAKCPKCGNLMPRWMDTCGHCGHVRERKSMVSSVPGEMEELQTMSRENKQKWWSMLQWYVHNQGWSPGRAAHTYKDKFGVWPRNLSDVPVMPDNDVAKFVDAKIRAYIRRVKRGIR